MSMYICDPELIAVLAAEAVLRGPRNREAQMLEKAVETAGDLMTANIQSVAARYPGDGDGERPGPRRDDGGPILDAELLAETRELAKIAYGELRRGPRPDWLEVARLVDEYESQSSEHDGWLTSEAKWNIDFLRKLLIRSQPGYELDLDAPRFQLAAFEKRPGGEALSL